MAEKYQLTEQTLAYVTAEEVTNTQKEYLVAGSQNVLIDRNRKVRTRPGYSRRGLSNNAETPVKNGFTWHTSNELQIPIRFYDDEMEADIETIDGVAINTNIKVIDGLGVDVIQRSAKIFDATENIDLLITINGDDKLYEWNGAIAVVDSITATEITKKGTDTFAQNRFYTTRNKIVTCVRTRTDYTYTGGEGTLTLTGIADTTGLIAGDILIQKVVQMSSAPIANRKNHTIFAFQNQICIGSEDDEKIYVSKNTSYYDFTFSSPRIPGDGALLTLDGVSKGFGIIGENLLCFAGRDGIFRLKYEQLTVGDTLTETLNIKKLDTGVDQGAKNQETIIAIGDALVYLTNEPAVRFITDPDAASGINPTTYSNPIKPDFDAEDFENACATFWKNTYYLSAPNGSRVYMLEFVQDSDGKTRRFWQPPQILPVRAFTIINDWIHGHSNVVAETYKLFDNEVYSDISSDDEKLPINAVARYAYRNFGDRTLLKNFDEYAIDGEVLPSVNDLVLTLRYDFDGNTQTIDKTIDGQDDSILLGRAINASLGQNALAMQPLGGSLTTPDNANKFGIIFEIPKEDFTMLQAEFSTNEVDRYWAIISHGGNTKLSPRKNTFIKK
jgi:hypothetical protein